MCAFFQKMLNVSWEHSFKRQPFDESANQHLELEVKTLFQSKTNTGLNKIKQLLKVKKLKCLWKFYAMKTNYYVRCVGWLFSTPLPYNTRQPYLINRQHHLAKLIVWDMHERLKHISVKQVLIELRRRCWICNGRGFVCILLHKCTVCRK